MANLKYTVRTMDPTGIFETNPEGAYHATNLDDAKQHLLDLANNGKAAVISCHDDDGRCVGTIYRDENHQWAKTGNV